jgi:hypothetical protein
VRRIETAMPARVRNRDLVGAKEPARGLPTGKGMRNDPVSGEEATTKRFGGMQS